MCQENKFKYCKLKCELNVFIKYEQWRLQFPVASHEGFVHACVRVRT